LDFARIFVAPGFAEEHENLFAPGHQSGATRAASELPRIPTDVRGWSRFSLKATGAGSSPAVPGYTAVQFPPVGALATHADVDTNANRQKASCNQTTGGNLQKCSDDGSGALDGLTGKVRVFSFKPAYWPKELQDAAGAVVSPCGQRSDVTRCFIG